MKRKVDLMLEDIEHYKNEIFQLKNIIKNLPGSIYWKDKNGVYLGHNNYALEKMKIVGFHKKHSVEKIIGKTDYDLFPKDVADQYRTHDEKVMKEKKEFSFEELLPLTDENILSQVSIKYPLFNSSSEVVGVVGNTLDISNLKEAEKEKYKAMMAIGSSIAHELRTPLASINSAVGGLKKYFPILLDSYLLAKNAGVKFPEVPSKHFENLLTLLDDIQSELHSANTIINMLLQNIKQPNLEVNHLVPCSISECVEEAVCRYPFTSDKQAELINFDYKHDFTFMGNQLLMLHVLFNLIKNALYAIEAAGKGEIHIWTECEHDQNILYFQDTGTGIPQSILPKLFDRFFTTSLHGTGLGLAFSKSVMQAFGGNITCESIEGKFTVFKLFFPIT